MSTELFHTVPYIKEARDGGEEAGAENPDPEQAEIEIPFQKDPADGNHLEEGGEFAGEVGADGDFADDEADKDGAHTKEKIAADDDAREPKGNGTEIRFIIESEQDDGGDEQKFIGSGVENGAEFALLVVFAGDVAIHAVQNGGDGKGEQTRKTADFVTGADVVDSLDHEERDEENAQDGNLVGGGHRNLLIIAYDVGWRRSGCQSNSRRRMDLQLMETVAGQGANSQTGTINRGGKTEKQ